MAEKHHKYGPIAMNQGETIIRIIHDKLNEKRNDGYHPQHLIIWTSYYSTLKTHMHGVGYWNSEEIGSKVYQEKIFGLYLHLTDYPDTIEVY